MMLSNFRGSRSFSITPNFQRTTYFNAGCSVQSRRWCTQTLCDDVAVTAERSCAARF